ncbi:coiled-coil domain-containing protein 112 isoform X2 [Oncorhynchus mykiss]|uniref:Coiled-coil domain-containing protein 112 n=1 Tax=Oncorhynchus mykiss TaxID=8022 RepID=A0A8C7SEL2_ONCMY|nr:coiled-coil domain-containing protein 112 isoform X2 [Oncorhynchus mykiss]
MKMASITTKELFDAQLLEGDFITATHHNAQRLEDRVSQQKTEFLRNAEKLRKQIEKLEKEKMLNTQNRKNGLSDGFRVLEEFDKGLQDDRNTEQMNVQKHLMKIHNGVNKFQMQLTDVKPTPELIEKLKDIMTEVENSINTFKGDQRQSFEDLLKEERTCSQEICAFEKKIETWSLAVKADPKLPPAPPGKVCLAKALEEDLPPEVTALERFLQQTGGKQGGWDQYDHQSFLKVWTKHNGKPAYRKEALLYLPGRTPDNVEQHEDWYLELLYLQEKKKEAIYRWKVERQQERAARLQHQDELENVARREREAQAETQQRRAEEERREAVARLEGWKRQRRLRLEQEEEQRLTGEILQRRQAKEERRRQLEVKLVLEAHIRQKKEEEELLTMQKEEQEQADMEEKKRLAGYCIKRFQERDFQKLETKVQEKQEKEKQELDRQKRLAKLKEKAEAHISRDPSRLCKPTKGWEERTKEIGPTGGGPVLQMFHRAVPSWRQGL